MSVASISVRGARKKFGDVEAVNGIDLTVEKGSILGLLGPNGAGKTTLIRMLATLTAPDEGEFSIEGFDVRRSPTEVRRVIGLAGQYAAVDENLTGRENLEMFGRLYRKSSRDARERASELLERFGLSDAGDRLISTYSGGMRRRLDLAGSLVNNPPVLFLDEPTTGLDPQSRLALWRVIRELVAGGTTVLLTTQYLEEADHLAERIVVVDHGRVIAEGTPRDLKAEVGSDVLEIRINDVGQVNKATAAVRAAGASNIKVDFELQKIAIQLDDRARTMQKIILALDAAHVELDDLTLRHPSLDEVFLTITGHRTE